MAKRKIDFLDKSEKDIIFEDIMHICKEEFPNAIVVDLTKRKKSNQIKSNGKITRP